MANTNQADTGLVDHDHDYNLNALAEACDEDEIEEMMVETAKQDVTIHLFPARIPRK